MWTTADVCDVLYSLHPRKLQCIISAESAGGKVFDDIHSKLNSERITEHYLVHVPLGLELTPQDCDNSMH